MPFLPLPWRPKPSRVFSSEMEKNPLDKYFDDANICLQLKVNCFQKSLYTVWTAKKILSRNFLMLGRKQKITRLVIDLKRFLTALWL